MIRSSIPKPEPIVPNHGLRAFIRRQPCILAGRTPCECDGFLREGNRLVSDCCHVKTRGAGGRDEHNVYPGCRRHHGEQEDGIKSFERKYGVCLKALAHEFTERYLAETAWQDRSA
ncbi:MAG TPA: hypothetical protein VK681_39105 [Reyranella sp.]|nr:hypothetical protein [Reyranella sp.]